MSLRNLPKICPSNDLAGVEWRPSETALARWQPGVQAAGDSEEASISIYEVIGEDPWAGGGVTAKRVAGALRSIGQRDVVVNVNSPGGDFFEGVAIYNLLREHPAKVTVQVVGLAASAASIIAMAGDKVSVARTAFVMIHNTWVIAIGDRHDMRSAADTLESFDDALAGVYAERSGIDKAEVAAMLDAETWFNGEQAVDRGIADDLLASDAAVPAAENNNRNNALAVRRVDAALASQGLSRSERRSLIGDLKGGTPGAAAAVTQDADATWSAAAARSLISTLK